MDSSDEEDVWKGLGSLDKDVRELLRELESVPDKQRTSDRSKSGYCFVSLGLYTTCRC